MSEAAVAIDEQDGAAVVGQKLLLPQLLQLGENQEAVAMRERGWGGVHRDNLTAAAAAEAVVVTAHIRWP